MAYLQQPLDALFVQQQADLICMLRSGDFMSNPQQGATLALAMFSEHIACLLSYFDHKINQSANLPLTTE